MFFNKSLQKSSIISQYTFQRLCIEGLTELWIRPGDKPCGKLLLSGLSVSDSPLLSDRCCRHRSMHHAFVKLPLLHPPPFHWNTIVSPHMYLRAHRHPYKTCVRESMCTHMQRIQTPFPLWWQILPELASICESWCGVLYESNSPIICLSQMDLQGIQGPCLVAVTAGWFYIQLSWSGWRTDMFSSFKVQGGNSSTRGSG